MSTLQASVPSRDWWVRDEQDANAILEAVVATLLDLDEKIIDLLLEAGEDGEKAANSNAALALSERISNTADIAELVRQFITGR